MIEVIIHSDGAARGNPGPAGAGAVLADGEGRTVGEVCRYLGDRLTNNQAEYRALLLALDEAVRRGARSVRIYADSELVVRQIKGEYRVKDSGLKPLFERARALLGEFEGYTIEHVARARNRRADELANLAIDGRVL